VSCYYFHVFNLDILLKSKNMARPHEIRFTSMSLVRLTNSAQQNHAEAAPQQPQIVNIPLKSSLLYSNKHGQTILWTQLQQNVSDGDLLNSIRH